MVLHLSGNNNLILRAKQTAKPNQKVFDKQARNIGKIIDTFGPAKTPFISIKPLTANAKKYVGKVLYLK
jgi:rRNA processing protein Gar1